MQGEIITTGTELITGRVGDFNARYAARRLHEAGLRLQSITILGDNAPLFQDALTRAMARSQFIIITGGLGPTDDDLTVAAAAQALNLRLFEDEALLARIRRCLEERGLPWEDRYARLALIPEGATVLDPGASACGFSLKHQGAWLFFLPGVPKEMQLLFDSFVLPFLVGFAAGGDYMRQRTLRLFGMSETQLQETVNKLGEWQKDVCVGFYPNFPENHLTLTLRGQDPQALEEDLDRLTAALGREVGEVLLGPEAATLEELVGRRLREKELTLAVAESCTGGLICHRLTNVPGSSDYFMGGVVSYSNEAKMDLLRVPKATLEKNGAVSEAAVKAMALGVKEIFHTPLGLAVTGIAGPSGGTPEKPVGTVWIGLAAPSGVAAKSCRFHGSREEIKALSAQTALDWLRRELK
ncbi:MAG: competence/damage-inducible protein A [Deltaproteobacteria bacterium]|nr:MAG: competence/damage-inducible protein A [Deltaproteobacteria bacterium]